MRGNRLPRIAGYAAFSLASLLFFFYFTFPGQAVGQRLEHEISLLTKNKVRASFEEVSLYRLTGVQADGVKLQFVREQGEPIAVDLDSLSVRLRLLPLLLLRLSGSATIEAGDGSLDVDVTKKGDAVELGLEIDELSTPLQKLLTQMVGVPIHAKVDAELDTSLGLGPDKPDKPDKVDKPGPGPRRPGATSLSGVSAKAGGLAPERSDGSGSLSLGGASIGPGMISGFTIPAPISFGDIEMKLELKKGKLRVTSFQQKGGQVSLDLTGSVNLRSDPLSSSLETCIKFKFTDDAYLAKHTKVATALQLLSVRLQKDGDGFYNAQLGGTLSRPRSQRGLCRGSGRRETAAREPKKNVREEPDSP